MSRQNYKVSGLELFTGTSIIFGDGSIQTTAAFGSSTGSGVTTWDQILHKNDVEGPVSVAIGQQAGQTDQGTHAIAFGSNAGSLNQGTHAIAIGPNAGQVDQGEYAIAIGNNAGQTTQSSYSIVLNAGLYPLDATEHGFYVSPIRYSTETEFALFYDGTTKEIIQTTPSIRAVSAPLTLTSPGKLGDVAFDQDYIYHCFSTYVPGQTYTVTTLEGYKAAHGGEPADWQNQTSTYTLSVLRDTNGRDDVQPYQWVSNGLTMTQIISVTTESSIAGIIDHCVLSTLTGVVNFSTETELTIYIQLPQESLWRRTPWNASTNPSYVRPPITLAGSPGDVAGRIAFSSTSMYYSIADFDPATIAPISETFLTLNAGTTSTSTIIINGSQFPNYTVPQRGWYVDIDGVSYELRRKYLNTSSYTATISFMIFNDVYGQRAQFTVPNIVTIYNPAPGEENAIWKTLPFSQNLLDVYPSTDSTYNLGKTTSRWNIAFVNTLSLFNGIIFPDSTIQTTAFTGTNFDGNLGTNTLTQNWSHTRTTNYSSVSTSTSTVVWTSIDTLTASSKLLIQVEADETGDVTGWHTQSCEAIIAARSNTGDPHMTVYGVTHTSVDPLMTFTVSRNGITDYIEVTATPTATMASTAYVKIHSVEMTSSI